MDTMLAGGAVLFSLIALFIAVGIIVISVIANWILFKKAGKSGWESILPFYNTFILVEMAGLNWWWFLLAISTAIVSLVSEDLLAIASLVSWVASFNCYYNLAKKFRKSTLTSVLAGIFPGIFIFIFAFSKNEIYYDKEPVSPNGIFPDGNNTVRNKKDDTKTLRFCLKCGCKVEENHKFCSICGNKLDDK